MSKLTTCFRDAVAACERGYSTVDFEAQFVRLLEYIEAHPELKPEAESLFLSALLQAPTPWELISFCMHKLRWQGVYDAANEILENQRELRSRRILTLILGAFRDDWEDVDLYSYYSGPGGQPRR